MNRDVFGANDQLVITWGSNTLPDGSIEDISSQPMGWVCACRCGKKISGKGYPTLDTIGWEALGKSKTEEVFCSKKCAVDFAPELVAVKLKRLTYHLQGLSDVSQDWLSTIKARGTLMIPGKTILSDRTSLMNGDYDPTSTKPSSCIIPPPYHPPPKVRSKFPWTLFLALCFGFLFPFLFRALKGLF